MPFILSSEASQCCYCSREGFEYLCNICAGNLVDYTAPVATTANMDIPSPRAAHDMEKMASQPSKRVESFSENEKKKEKHISRLLRPAQTLEPTLPRRRSLFRSFRDRIFEEKPRDNCMEANKEETNDIGRLLETVLEDSLSAETETTRMDIKQRSRTSTNQSATRRLGKKSKSTDLRHSFSIDSDLQDQTRTAVAVEVNRIEARQIVCKTYSKKSVPTKSHSIKRKPIPARTSSLNATKALNGQVAGDQSTKVLIEDAGHDFEAFGVHGNHRNSRTLSLEESFTSKGKGAATKTTSSIEPCQFCGSGVCKECPPIQRVVHLDMTMSKTFCEDFRQCNTFCKHQLCADIIDTAIIKCGSCGHRACDNCKEIVTHRVQFHPNTKVGNPGKILQIQKKPETFCICCMCEAQKKDYHQVQLKLINNRVRFTV
ncbi:hypothetical protein GLAREA_03955 [Glarea lozoyensis ATCC 20868]|uniref:Uncharacterized protein n=1 Tax=Glarea lozoyensis (strain ATCC 20868 / MF5171) TaxID=1116229 RepID=S3DX80_GLAL2|nr:uncharacterized protein GLAREA_03955 [Glarea lozoyensis ATCC 20868]EPE30988.1 hypothetical protein GLAREA_03955 [Glarea lozoyensis ATCC 20868]